jgi:hypothetical protein
MSDVRGFDAYRLSRYRTYHNYSRGNNLLGKTMDQLQFEQMLGDISISQADAFARSLESIIVGYSNFAGDDARSSLLHKKRENLIRDIINKLQNETEAHFGNSIIPSEGILFAPTRETDAYIFMRLVSLITDSEVGGWLTNAGVLVEPLQGKLYNGLSASNNKTSCHGFLPVGIRNGTISVEHNNARYQIFGRVHTHLSENGPSYEDYLNSAAFEVPNFVIGNTNVFVGIGIGTRNRANVTLKAYGSFKVTSQVNLFNNNISLIDLSKQLRKLFY